MTFLGLIIVAYAILHLADRIDEVVTKITNRMPR
jgi:hypothetical protein